MITFFELAISIVLETFRTKEAHFIHHRKPQIRLGRERASLENSDPYLCSPRLYHANVQADLGLGVRNQGVKLHSKMLQHSLEPGCIQFFDLDVSLIGAMEQRVEPYIPEGLSPWISRVHEICDGFEQQCNAAISEGSGRN